MATDRFSFFIPDPDYCDYLRQFDSRVPINSGDKSKRPFIGLVFQINDFQYYAGLASPKDKHSNMKNMADFIKINNGDWGVINLNNMIPVPQRLLTKVDFSLLSVVTAEDRHYKNLLQNQLSWCNEIKNKDFILEKAEKLYYSITNYESCFRNRCCDYILLEQECLKYCSINKINLRD
ncbi:MAG: type III toxin-antitoxin system ToxN/AbiQ family toxin [Methanosarcinales archaeon]|jgi:protein AbiQ|nr:type III toxin-antitoxin system ToxN/AbiQ family toxin [Methanosarcinales archaeon]